MRKMQLMLIVEMISRFYMRMLLEARMQAELIKVIWQVNIDNKSVLLKNLFLQG